MQVVAWSKMIVDYSAQDGLVEGARKTFDGEHPCCLCKAIDEGKKNESKGEGDDKAPLLSSGLVLKDCLFETSVKVPSAPSRPTDLIFYPALDQRGISFGTSPPSPPPRGQA